MPAFTQLCKNVNISLFDDTITLYLKKSELTHKEKILCLRTWNIICVEINCLMLPDIEPRIETLGKEIGIVRYVRRNDKDHMRYHDDNLSIDFDHIHAQWSKTIDADKLSHIITVFIQYDILSEDEGKGFMSAYHQANSLTLIEDGISPADELVGKELALLEEEILEEITRQKSVFSYKALVEKETTPADELVQKELTFLEKEILEEIAHQKFDFLSLPYQAFEVASDAMELPDTNEPRRISRATFFGAPISMPSATNEMALPSYNTSHPS